MVGRQEGRHRHVVADETNGDGEREIVAVAIAQERLLDGGRPHDGPWPVGARVRDESLGEHDTSLGRQRVPVRLGETRRQHGSMARIHTRVTNQDSSPESAGAKLARGGEGAVTAGAAKGWASHGEDDEDDDAVAKVVEPPMLLLPSCWFAGVGDATEKRSGT